MYSTMFIMKGDYIMARPQKSLEEQLKNAKNELAKTLEKEQSLREKIANIEAAIEDRDMHEYYTLLKEHEISIEELQTILKNRAKVIS